MIDPERPSRAPLQVLHIKYSVDAGDAIEKRELAFVMGVMSDLSGDRRRPLPDLGDARRDFIGVDRHNIGEIQRVINPHLELAVRNELLDDGTTMAVSLDFSDLDGFSPTGVIAQIGPLRELFEERRRLALLAVRDAGTRERVFTIDAILCRQVDAILHDPRFQKLEASWRGLHYLVQNTETGPLLELRLLNVSKDELLQDLTAAREFDQSQIFAKLSQPFDTYGGVPFGAVMGDYEFDGYPSDIKLLTEMSHVAAAVHAPFLAAASPRLFDWRSFADLLTERGLSKIFDPNLNPDYVKWHQFRESEDSRFVALVLPRVLMRAPYAPAGHPAEEFEFIEDLNGLRHDRYLWGNAAYALAQRINQSFAEYGWHMAICGLEGSGRITGLPVHTFIDDAGARRVTGPAEAIVWERRAGELIRIGLVPLVMSEQEGAAVVVDVPSCGKPKEYGDAFASANARLSMDLRCILSASRFTHYLKAICRDKQGTFTTPEQLQTNLQTWLVENYTVANADAKQAIKSSRPLREGKVDVRQKPGKPGYYATRVWLALHVPFKGLTASVAMSTEMRNGK